MSSVVRALRSPANWGLAALYVFTGAAITGFGLFALNPEMIPDSESARRVFRASYPLFAQGHIWLACAVLVVALAPRGGFGWLPGALAVATVAFLSEYLGTGYGIPFGEYEYTALLGDKIGGRVPWPIPVSWYLMALPSYVIARHAYPEAGERTVRITLATAFLVAWDLALDPAMSFLTPYWRWGVEGAYYGMPAVNLVGWAVTGVVLMAILEATGTRVRAERLSVRWMAAYWAVMVLLPVGMLAAAGAWLAVAVTAAAVVPLSLWVRHRAAARLAARPDTSRRNAPERPESGTAPPVATVPGRREEESVPTGVSGGGA